jgi:NAD(P)-dependent dehydrogenase (short-subunit alcohol dehydrogenase family)
LGDHGIRFDALSPGPVDIPMMDGHVRSLGKAIAIRAQFVAAVPPNRMCRRGEMAFAATFLASDDSSLVVSAELSVGSGMAQV